MKDECPKGLAPSAESSAKKSTNSQWCTTGANFPEDRLQSGGPLFNRTFPPTLQYPSSQPFRPTAVEKRAWKKTRRIAAILCYFPLLFSSANFSVQHCSVHRQLSTMAFSWPADSPFAALAAPDTVRQPLLASDSVPNVHSWPAGSPFAGLLDLDALPARVPAQTPPLAPPAPPASGLQAAAALAAMTSGAAASVVPASTRQQRGKGKRPGDTPGGKQAAAEAVREVLAGRPAKQMAAEHGVAVSTLYRHVAAQKRGKRIGRAGAPAQLSAEDEKALVAWIHLCSRCGFSPSVERIITKASALAAFREKPFPADRKATRGWYRGFRLRHPVLRESRARAIAAKRAGLNWSDIRSAHDELQRLVKEHGIPADRIFNWDETGISKFVQLDKGRRGKLVHTEDSAPVQVVRHWNSHITVGCCVSAAGTALPPVVITKGVQGRISKTAAAAVTELDKLPEDDPRRPPPRTLLAQTSRHPPALCLLLPALLTNALQTAAGSRATRSTRSSGALFRLPSAHLNVPYCSSWITTTAGTLARTLIAISHFSLAQVLSRPLGRGA